MAITTIKVEGIMKEKFRTEIKCSNDFVIDQPTVAGGNNEGPNPLEVFVSTLPACICAIGRIIATQKRINLRGISARAEGDIDKDFLLGKTTEGRAGFQEIRCFVDIDADMTFDEKEAFLKEIEDRCPIADNMTNSSVIRSEVKE